MSSCRATNANRSRAVCEIQVPRAKALPLRESGVFRAVHVRDNDSSDGPTEVPGPTPGSPDSGIRLRSIRRAAAREEIAPQLGVAMDLAGLSDCDVGAVLDEAPQRVAKIRAGHLPITADHLALLARSRDARAAQVAEHVIRQIRGRQ